MKRLSFIFFLFIIMSCTSNPFWHDPTKNELILKGIVTAENKHTDVPISIWMESFDQYTITDSDGNFSIPINNSQSGTGHISGPVKIYFFIYNYDLDSATVFFTNGELSKDQTDFSTNGDLIKRVELTKILSGEMEFQLLENRFYDQDTVLLTFDGGIHSTVSIDLYKYIWKDEFDFLADDWAALELESFDQGDPSMMGNAETKRLLRRAMVGVLPDAIGMRWNKQGFLPPQEMWFRSDLLTAVKEVFHGRAFAERGWWNVGWWNKTLDRFERGEDHLAWTLWKPFIAEAWMDRFVTSLAASEKQAVFDLEP